MSDQKCLNCEKPSVFVCECTLNGFFCDEHTKKHFEESDKCINHPIRSILRNQDIQLTDVELDFNTLKEGGLDLTPHKVPITCIAYKENYLFIAQNHFIGKYDLLRNCYDSELNANSIVWSVCVSPNNPYLGAALDNGSILLINYEEMTIEHQASPSEESITSVQFTINGELILATTKSGSFLAYKCEDFKQYMNKTVKSHCFISMTSDPGSKFAFTGASNGKIVSWDLRTKAKGDELISHKQAVVALLWDLYNLYSASYEGTIIVWDVPGKRPKTQISVHKNRIISMTVDPSKTRLYLTDSSRYIRSYDLKNKKFVEKNWTGYEILASLTYNYDENEVYCISGDRTIRKFHGQTLEPTGSVGNSELFVAKTTTNREYVVCGFRDGWVKFFNMSTGTIDYDFHYLQGAEIFSNYQELEIMINQ